MKKVDSSDRQYSEEAFRVYLLQNDSVRNLCQTQSWKYSQQNSISNDVVRKGVTYYIGSIRSIRPIFENDVHWKQGKAFKTLKHKSNGKGRSEGSYQHHRTIMV